MRKWVGLVLLVSITAVHADVRMLLSATLNESLINCDETGLDGAQFTWWADFDETVVGEPGEDGQDIFTSQGPATVTISGSQGYDGTYVGSDIAEIEEAFDEGSDEQVGTPDDSDAYFFISPVVIGSFVLDTGYFTSAQKLGYGDVGNTLNPVDPSGTWNTGDIEFENFQYNAEEGNAGDFSLGADAILDLEQDASFQFYFSDINASTTVIPEAESFSLVGAFGLVVLMGRRIMM